MKRRDVSSVAVLTTRVRAVGLAFAAGDEHGAREELRRLANEAQLLARMVPLMPTRLESRQRIAGEREPIR